VASYQLSEGLFLYFGAEPLNDISFHLFRSVAISSQGIQSRFYCSELVIHLERALCHHHQMMALL
jgi:hypothetical protein